MDMNQELTFFQKHKTKFVAVACLLLAFGAGYGTSSVASPAKIVTKTEVKTETITLVEYKDRIVTQKIYVKAKKQQQHVETTTTKTPDGTVTTKVVADNKVDETDKTDTHQEQEHQNNQSNTVTQTIVQTKIVTNQPNWSVYAGVGVSIPHFLGQGDLGVPGLQGFVVQAGIDRRILGPFSVGIFANTQGTTGLNLRGSF